MRTVFPLTAFQAKIFLCRGLGFRTAGYSSVWYSGVFDAGLSGIDSDIQTTGTIFGNILPFSMTM